MCGPPSVYLTWSLLSFLNMWMNIFHEICEFSATFSSNSFLVPLFFLSFWNVHYASIDILMMSHRSLTFCLFLILTVFLVLHCFYGAADFGGSHPGVPIPFVRPYLRVFQETARKPEIVLLLIRTWAHLSAREI